MGGEDGGDLVKFAKLCRVCSVDCRCSRDWCKDESEDCLSGEVGVEGERR